MIVENIVALYGKAEINNGRIIKSFVILMIQHLKNQMRKRKTNRNLRVPYQRKCRDL